MEQVVEVGKKGAMGGKRPDKQVLDHQGVILVLEHNDDHMVKLPAQVPGGRGLPGPGVAWSTQPASSSKARTG